MNNNQEKIEKYKFRYKIFSTLGTLVLVDMLLSGAGIPFIGAFVLYPILSLIFVENTTLSILGFYSSSWIFLFIPAIILNRKVKSLEKESGGTTERSEGMSKSFKTIILFLLVPFGIMMAIGIILNILD